LPNFESPRKNFRIVLIRLLQPPTINGLRAFFIAPYYVLSKAEYYFDIPINDHQKSNHVLSLFSSPFNRQELSLAIFSRKSPAAGLDDITPILYKHLPIKAFNIILKLLNDLWLNNIIPEVWRQLSVIPIPKPAAKPPT